MEICQASPAIATNGTQMVFGSVQGASVCSEQERLEGKSSQTLTVFRPSGLAAAEGYVKAIFERLHTRPGIRLVFGESGLPKMDSIMQKLEGTRRSTSQRAHRKLSASPVEVILATMVNLLTSSRDPKSIHNGQSSTYGRE